MTHVLIVDDQALNRILLEKMLLEENYKISIAFNGLEALEVLEKEEHELLKNKPKNTKSKKFRPCGRRYV